MSNLLQDRVAVVSGVGPGIGREIALACAREGASVALGARTAATLEEVAAAVGEAGGKAVWAATDVTSPEQCAALSRAALEAFGRIDVLVSNAFVHTRFGSVESTGAGAWREAFEVNVLGSLNMTKAVVPSMREQGSGSIVFINSMSARRAGEGSGAYSATKSALLTAARTLARELGPDRIRVNSVVPGYVWGPSLRWYFEHLAKRSGRSAEEVYEEVAAETALRRIPTSEEVAKAVVFLASDLASGITGQSLDVNAGHWFH